jgi:hypothetical protein
VSTAQSGRVPLALLGALHAQTAATGRANAGMTQPFARSR